MCVYMYIDINRYIYTYMCDAYFWDSNFNEYYTGVSMEHLGIGNNNLCQKYAST